MGWREVDVSSLLGGDRYVHSLTPVAGETYPETIRITDTEVVATGSHFGDISLPFADSNSRDFCALSKCFQKANAKRLRLLGRRELNGFRPGSVWLFRRFSR